MTKWLDVSVIGGIWGISNQPIFSNSNNLRNIWKAVDRGGNRDTWGTEMEGSVSRRRFVGTLSV
jgi:hypothetical protein